jgi:integrase
MADANDVQGYRRKFENQRERLADADLDDRDRDAIDRFVVHLRANDASVASLGTVVGHLNRLRLSAERAHVPLVEFADIGDVDAFKLHLEDVHGLSEGTIRNYMKAIRKFYVWRGCEWGEDITVGAPPDRTVDPDEEITADELSAVLDAAPNPRDRALIAVLADTSLRIGAVLSFRICHVDFETRKGTITINENANVKDVSGAQPLSWSRGYVANWLDDHPRPDDPDAALFHKRQQYEPGDDALSQQYAGRRIASIAAEAGLDPDRIHAHLFRATRISQWIRGDMDEQQIKHLAGWEKDSRQFETYSLVSDEEMNDAVFAHWGIADADADEAGPVITECPQCRTTLRGDETFCKGCGAPVSIEAAAATDEAGETLRDIMVEADDPDVRAAAADTAAAAENDPVFASALIDELKKLG